MTKNVKLGNDVVSGVQKWQFESADTEGTWVDYVETSDADAAASDIKNGKIAYVNGVKITGNHTDKTEQTKTAALSMASGDQVVTPDTNKVLTQVTITKPDTLVSGNIKKDVVIGGVTGSYEGGITPTGTINISQNGQVDVTNYATADVAVISDGTTYKPFPAGWNTSGTIAQFCGSVNTDAEAVEGMVYLGELTCSDLPTGLASVEAVVEVIEGTGTSGKTIHIIITSGNVSPYRWEYTYWNDGTNVSGWKTWLSTEGGTMTGWIVLSSGQMGLRKSTTEPIIWLNSYGQTTIGNADPVYIQTSGGNPYVYHTIGSTTYHLLDGQNTSANPTLVGGETSLTSIKLDGTDYAISGGTQVTFVDWS